MRALVTGAFGFAGRHLVPYLISEGDTVLASYLDFPPEHDRKNMSPAQIGKLDVCELENCRKVISEFQPEAIYHLAGMAFAPDAEKNFREALKLNVESTYNVLRAADSLHKPIRVLLVSSSEVYGRVAASELPARETSELRPNANYSLTKCMGEQVALRFHDRQNLKIVIARSFNHIGPGQRRDFVVSSFAWQLAKIKKGYEAPRMLVGNLDAQRDFSDVRDIIRGYRLAIEKGSGTYNFCSGRAVSIKTILETLIKISGCAVDIAFDADRMRPSEVAVFYGSHDKAKRELGWSPKNNDLESSLKTVFDFWYSNI